MIPASQRPDDFVYYDQDDLWKVDPDNPEHVIANSSVAEGSVTTSDIHDGYDITILQGMSKTEIFYIFVEYVRFTDVSKMHSNEGILYLSRDMRFPTMWYMRPVKAQTSLCICTV